MSNNNPAISKFARQLLGFFEENNIHSIGDLRNYSSSELIPQTKDGCELLKFRYSSNSQEIELGLNEEVGSYELKVSGNTILIGSTNPLEELPAHIKEIKEDLSDLASAA